MSNRPDIPSPAELWRQADGDGDRYRQLLRDHGMLVAGPPEPLPCGWTPGKRSTATPVPSIDPPPHPIEIQARALHAVTCRMETPDVTDGQILDAWDALPDDGRQWLLDTAQRRMEARLAEPGKPDDLEALTRRLTGMSPDEVRRATEAPEHRAARQRTDEEQAALAPPARVGRWVAGQGWVPVDGRGPYEGSAR